MRLDSHGLKPDESGRGSLGGHSFKWDYQIGFSAGWIVGTWGSDVLSEFGWILFF